jgi:predicted nucleic acid-binding protein
MTLVVDASAIGAIVFGEPDGTTIAAHVEDESLVAPALIDYELANIACKKIRRRPAQRLEVTAAFSAMHRLQIKRLPVPIDDVLSLALDTGLSAYDASYLWLAMSRDIELVTLDNRLARINQMLREGHA